MLQETQPIFHGCEGCGDPCEGRMQRGNRHTIELAPQAVAAPAFCSVRALSAHEVAALMVLSYASVETGTATADIVALKDRGLAVVMRCTEGTRIAITALGQSVLDRFNFPHASTSHTGHTHNKGHDD